MGTSPKEISNFIRSKAVEYGFSYCGISKAVELTNEAKELEQWLNKGQNGEMKWMENYFEKRVDPRKLMPGAKSVVSFMLNYYPEKKQNPNVPQISKYAYGEDYHFVIKRKLKSILMDLENEVGQFEGRAFVDSAPVMDKAWARKSGLGWVGKHTNIIHPKAGSYFFLCELILDLELEYDGPIKDYCGTCTACIDACPTDAIVEPYKVDGSKCISYFTIELKGALPALNPQTFENWAFGCDICQDVCPWNRFSKPHSESTFDPHPKLLEMKNVEWKDITQEVFSEIFKKSAVKRTKFEGLKRNLRFLGATSKNDN
ncbi:MAG: tRNA epoxyqueuosine(34) reductase QueG [Flavobacteriales bacterium]|nr:tRNA epoxyqueuosine(34) reductase QueG [Flavobacteriales bacterium]